MCRPTYNLGVVSVTPTTCDDSVGPEDTLVTRCPGQDHRLLPATVDVPISGQIVAASSPPSKREAVKPKEDSPSKAATCESEGALLKSSVDRVQSPRDEVDALGNGPSRGDGGILKLNRKQERYEDYTPRKSPEEARPEGADNTARYQMLSCPYRKRNPVRFNVRNYQNCAVQSFPDISQLK